VAAIYISPRRTSEFVSSGPGAAQTMIARPALGNVADGRPFDRSRRDPHSFEGSAEFAPPWKGLTAAEHGGATPSTWGTWAVAPPSSPLQPL